MTDDEIKRIASYDASTIVAAYLASNPTNPMRNSPEQVANYYTVLNAAIKESLK